MRVTRLEIFGFKSFMERLVLPLEGGVTGVVGPNGCGKSNVVDALRWVLGETRASNLRGETLEDVIFNGTDKLRPLGLAEVTITLRASEKDIFSDLVSPALEAEEFAKMILKEGESFESGPTDMVGLDARISEQKNSEPEESPRPHLTVIEGGGLRLDTEVALEGNEVIMTADDDSPAEATEKDPVPDGATSAMDAVAGTEAVAAPEGAVPASNTLLTRFAWLKSVNEVQVTRRLYRSGESEFFINRVPCRLKDLKDLFRAVGLGARAYTIVAQGEVSRIVTARPEDRRLIIEEAAGVLGFRDKIASASRRLEDTAQNVARLDDVIKEVTRQVGVLKKQAARARNRQELKDRASLLERAVCMDSLLIQREQESQIAQAEEEARSFESSAETQVQTAQTHEQIARTEMINVDMQGDRLRTRMENIREELERRARYRGEKLSRINELKAVMSSRRTEIDRMEERKRTLAERSAECNKEIENLDLQDLEIAESMQGFELGSEDELRAIAQKLEEQRADFRRMEQLVRDARDNMIKSQSTLESVQEQLIAASPVTQLRRTIGEASQALLGHSDEVKLFVDGLTVPPQYARAVQAVLAERTEYLVCENPHEIGSRFVRDVLGGAAGEQHGLGLGVFRSGCEAGPESPELGLPRLIDQIVVAPDCRLAAGSCLFKVYVAERIEQAFECFERIQNDPVLKDDQQITVVTCDGDILTTGSFYSLRHDGGVIQLKNRAAELMQECESCKQQHEALVEQRDRFQVTIEESEIEHAEALRRSRERQSRIRELSNQQGNIRGRLQSERRLGEQVQQDMEKVVAQIVDSQRSIEELREEVGAVQAELDALVPDEERELGEELEVMKDEWASLDEIRREGRMKISSATQKLEDARRLLDDARGRLAHAELGRQKLELEVQHLFGKVISEYGQDTLKEMMENLGTATRLEEETRADFQDELGKLKQRIIREGEVDPTSIERYEEENARLEDLTKQKGDLDDAAGILKKTIARLRETSEERFLATFEAVKNNFARLVPRLFGGGKAELTLTDPSRPLDSGVEIMARPPGKKPKTIDLLSGGEKALCATALIFAMFLERPSPLCVLDEVDAPLDESNLVRYLALIKEMSMKTQFLMITHNKTSMNTANNLVGVTMQEPGASKVITVSLQDAYSHVA
jgi:chromosome segregation protein